MLKVYSVYDQAAESYLRPFFAPTHGLAIRSFTSAANEAGHNFNLHAADYTLFQLGTFNEETGEIKPLSAPHSLGNALQFQEATANTPTLVEDSDS